MSEKQMRLSQPTKEDLELLERRAFTARLILWDFDSREDFDRSEDDLLKIQNVLDSGTLDPQAAGDFECLGIAFGNVLANAIPELEWAIIEDEYGRDPTLRFDQSSITLNVATLFTKRFEWDEDVDVYFLYEELLVKLERLSRDPD